MWLGLIRGRSICGVRFCTTRAGIKHEWSNPTKQRIFMEDLGVRKGHDRNDRDWMYNLTRDDLLEAGGTPLFTHCGYQNAIEAIKEIFPEHPWRLCKFTRFPRNFWQSEENRLQYLGDVAKEIGLEHPREWTKVSYSQLQQHHGTSLLHKYSSVRGIVESHYPQHPWKAWFADAATQESPRSLQKKPRNYWKEVKNQREFFDDLGRQLGITNLDQWNRVQASTIKEQGGASILLQYSSFYEALTSIYPEHSWDPLARDVLPRNEFWKNPDNHRLLMDSIVKNMGLDSPLDLQGVQKKDILAHGGRSLFQFYPTLYQALCAIYPEYEWDMFAFKPFPKNFWKERTIQRAFLDRFAEKHGIQKGEDWKRVSSRQIHESGGASILKQYSTIYDMLSTLYPEHSWDVFEARSTVPRHFWDNPQNVAQFLERVKEKYHIHSPSDWERMANFQIHDMGGAGLMQRYRTLRQILEFAYPEEDWSAFNLNGRDKRAAQRFLYLQLQTVFSGFEVIEDYVHEDLSRISGQGVEFDVFLPQLSIAVEYHGEHHYREIPSFGSIDLYQRRDQEKTALCQQSNIDLVVVPYTWDNQMDSLMVILRNQLPPSQHTHFTSLKEM